PWNVGRDENGRHANAQAVKFERLARSSFVRGRRVTIRLTCRRHYVVVDSAVLVVDDQERSRFPKLLVGTNGVIRIGDESLTLLHVVIGVLVRSKYLAAAWARMIVIARLDKAVVRKSVAVAIADELAVAAKNLWLILQEIHNLHRRALLVIIVNLCGAATLNHSFVDALDGILNVKQVHVHVAEGR